MKLLLIRHGQSEANINRLVTGNDDTPLTASGIAQAEQLRDSIQNLISQFDDSIAFYASPAKRALEPSRLAGVPSERLKIDHRLKETDAGAVKTMSLDKFNRLYPEFFGNFKITSKYPEGESHVEMIQRSIAFLSDIIHTNYAYQVVFAHNGSINSILHKCDNVAFEKFPHFKVGHCQIISRDVQPNIFDR